MAEQDMWDRIVKRIRYLKKEWRSASMRKKAAYSAASQTTEHTNMQSCRAEVNGMCRVLRECTSIIPEERIDSVIECLEKIRDSVSREGFGAVGMCSYSENQAMRLPLTKTINVLKQKKNRNLHSQEKYFQ
ncbi:MAG: hypothetical protein CMI52_02595 [Parcubacteria group bacterium]|nr:hypothetical protein [Parcubacteria group bacterium]